jgi:FkbM family methyltransferase
LYSCYAAKKKLCKVFAFEPSIFNLEWLGKNIFLNNLVNDITVIPIPLNKKKSESILNFSSTDWSGALSAFGQTYGHDGKDFKSILQYPTVGFSIDDAKNLLNIPQPDYIKIDVDGIEHLILMGGEEVLLKTKQLLIEVNDNFEEQKQSCIKSLTKMGFKLKEKRKNDILKNSNFSSTFNQIWVKQL